MRIVGNRGMERKFGGKALMRLVNKWWNSELLGKETWVKNSAKSLEVYD